jgi:hypothetical protein
LTPLGLAIFDELPEDDRLTMRRERDEEEERSAERAAAEEPQGLHPGRTGATSHRSVTRDTASRYLEHVAPAELVTAMRGADAKPMNQSKLWILP